MDMPPEERLGLAVKRAEQRLMAAKHAAVKAAGVTVPQYAALLALHANPGISAAALARECLVTPQAMNVVLKNLLEHGLIERSPHQWHRTMLETHLTDAGREALRVADEAAVIIERRIAAAFTPEERASLQALLTRFTQAIEGAQ
ncbi:MarR family winged helix-turn-helix transcriptional regulator [Nonomuraea spiralis]|uniref:MarR family winged helix-turn-helix transcriptional regulator n=1 Tax=Nonomuraea spiralis TaxID=46182 RepID=A0ABV5IKL3_9ACTN|nr:MarR family transcriptional regulator [Nonomuraea spiralis]GGT37075.1 putative transcriptional regulator, MarR family protein [Nonomuraea spiralis]